MRGLRARWLLLVLAFAAASSGAQQAAKIHMHLDDGYAADGLLFQPEVAQAPAALLLIHDDWGVTPALLDEARRLSVAGYLVVAVDLYRGRVAANAKEAAGMARELSRENVMHDLRAGLAFLRQQTSVRPNHIGVVGWGSGGTYALRLAAAEPGVSAVVTRGSPRGPDPGQLKPGKAAVLALSNGADAQDRMREFLKAKLRE
jgi:carboxymethylenebutenolidase